MLEKIHSKKHRLPHELMTILRSSMLSYEIIEGGKHTHIRIAGKLAGIYTRGTDSGRSYQNLRAQLRRAIREIKG